jgi:lipid A disaccharide synthetase
VVARISRDHRIVGQPLRVAREAATCSVAQAAMVASMQPPAGVRKPAGGVYRTSWLNYALAKRLVRIRVGLINVLRSKIAREFVQTAPPRTSRMKWRESSTTRGG